MSLVYLKNKKNGVTYVYESSGYWDKEKQQARNNRTCIGKLDPVTGKLVPSKSAVEKIIPAPKQPGPVPSVECKRSFYGATYLFDSIGEKLGIVKDLKNCFPESDKQILSLAYYLIMEDRNPLSRFPKWATTHLHPFGANIPSQRSSELFAAITEDAKQNFFVLQGKRRLEKEYLAYDTTSISSYSQTIKQVKWGHNKDHDPLPQINLALLFGEESRLPVYYRKLPGNLADVKTIQKLLADIDFLQLEKVKLVMDRGFYSEENINALYQKHFKFLIAGRISLKFIQDKLDEVRDTMRSRSNYSSKYRLSYYSSTIDWNYSELKKRSQVIEPGERRMYLHLFHNDQRATDDKIAFHELLDRLEEELLSGKRTPEHEKLYAKYFVINETPVRGMSLIPKQEAIDKAQKNYGYFALLSNGIKDPLEALEIYRSKDLIEKAFGNLKERLNMRRTSVSSDENLEGKLFVQFIALIYLSYIKKVMSEKNLFKNYTLQELLDELDIIECFDQPGRKSRVGEMTKKQMELYALFDVATPA
ncbi:MAG: IS1634 family transposase [Negativicutes bacterium]